MSLVRENIGIILIAIGGVIGMAGITFIFIKTMISITKNYANKRNGNDE